jgi:hypothetical protein
MRLRCNLIPRRSCLEDITCLPLRTALRGWQTIRRKPRRETAQGAKADKPKRCGPLQSLQQPAAECRTIVPAPLGAEVSHRERVRYCATMA